MTLAHFETLFGPEFGHGRAFDLAPLRALLAALGDPQTKLPPVVHVAGTNGKGSTLAFLRAIAEAAGQRVHAFTKPHLLRLNERFCVAGEIVSDDALIAAADRIAATGIDVSQFEAQVAAAFLLFTETPADLTLIETGFGGRDDATNVLPAPRIALITPIDLDHQDILGATIAEIAAHKAGILKSGALAISARQAPDAAEVLEFHAARVGAELQLCGRDWDAYAKHGRLIVQTEDRLLDLAPPSLIGAHQFDNAALAARAAVALGYDEDTISRGLARARWPGRLQPLTSGPLAARVLAAGGELWVDGGHNPHAARALAVALKALPPRPTVAIVAMRTRKDGAAFVGALAPALSRFIVLPMEGGIATETLAAYAHDAGVEADEARTLDDAVSIALATAAPRVLVCGSLALAGQALARA